MKLDPALSKPTDLLSDKPIQQMGGNARAAKLSSETKSQIAQLAAEARWQKKLPPDPTPEECRKFKEICEALESVSPEARVRIVRAVTAFYGL